MKRFQNHLNKMVLKIEKFDYFFPLVFPQFQDLLQAPPELGAY